MLNQKALHKMAKAFLQSEVSRVRQLVVFSANMRSNGFSHATAPTAALVNVLTDVYRAEVIFLNEAYTSQ